MVSLASLNIFDLLLNKRVLFKTSFNAGGEQYPHYCQFAAPAVTILG